MTGRCRRCGGEIDAKSAKRQYCDACRKQAAVERSVERSKAEGNAALAEERQRLGLTAREMAEYLGIGLRAYQYYESAEHYPDVPGLIALADYFEVSADYLLGRSDQRG